MTRFIFSLILCQIISVLTVSTSYAQKCDLVYEIIIELRDAKWGANNLWDTVYGDIKRSENFKSIITSLDGRNVIGAAEIFDDVSNEKHMTLVSVDKRGRVVWEKPHEIKGLDQIIKIIATDKSYIVLAQTKNNNSKEALWLGFFDEQGALIFSKPISKGKEKISPKDFILTRDGKTLLVAAQVQDVKMVSPASTMFYWFDVRTKRIKRDRKFALGTENAVYAIQQSHEDDDGFFVAGYIRGADGRMSGWVLKINESGGFEWQRQFARGLGGRLFDVSQFAQGKYLVAAGEAFAADASQKRAAWVIALDKNGEDVAWQRYYRENHNMSAKSVIAHDDGQISVLVDAKGSDIEDEKDYVRLVALNPRGVILDNLSFFNADGAGAYKMIQGANKERILHGYSDVGFQMEKKEMNAGDDSPMEIKKSRQGWIVAADAPNEYDDPCSAPEMVVP